MPNIPSWKPQLSRVHHNQDQMLLIKVLESWAAAGWLCNSVPRGMEKFFPALVDLNLCTRELRHHFQTADIFIHINVLLTLYFVALSSTGYLQM